MTPVEQQIYGNGMAQLFLKTLTSAVIFSSTLSISVQATAILGLMTMSAIAEGVTLAAQEAAADLKDEMAAIRHPKSTPERSLEFGQGTTKSLADRGLWRHFAIELCAIGICVAIGFALSVAVAHVTSRLRL